MQSSSSRGSRAASVESVKSDVLGASTETTFYNNGDSITRMKKVSEKIADEDGDPVVPERPGGWSKPEDKVSGDGLMGSTSSIGSASTYKTSMFMQKQALAAS